MRATRARTGGGGAVRVAGLAAVLSLMSPGAGEGQSARGDALEAGRRSVALALPEGGGGELTLWRMASDSRNRGLTVRFLAAMGGSEGPSGTAQSQRISLLAGPSFRRYLSRAAPVAPFVQTSLLVGGGYQSRDHDGVDQTHASSRWNAGGELGAGIGAEWFLHRRASVGGHTGLRFNGFFGSEGDSDNWHVELGTVTSALTLQIYF